MAWAKEMKNLVGEIKTGHQERTARIGEIKKETRNILANADVYMKKVNTELKEMAADLKDFLAKSEATRKKDFSGMMTGIRAKIKEIKGDIRNFLAKSEGKRMADFKTLKGDIDRAIAGIQERVKEIKRESKSKLSDYRLERKAAAEYWTSLRTGVTAKKGVREKVKAEEAPAVPTPAKRKKRGRPKKK